MKKHISLILLAALLMSVTACGENGLTPDTGKPDVNEDSVTDVPEKLTDGLPDKNMEGFEFRVLHTAQENISWANVQLDSEAENGDLVNDAIYKRNVAIEDRFKCGIKVDEEAKTYLNYANLVMSGDNPYDIIMVYGINALGVVDSYADINNIPYLNLDKPWWNPDATSVFEIGGKQVCAAGAFSISYASTANCLLFNKRIYDSMNTGESLYSIVDSGKWTTDKLFEIAADAASDLNGDSKMDGNDLWGINGTSKSFHHMLVIGSGQHYVTNDADGFPVFGTAKDEKLVSFLGKVVNLEKKDVYAYTSPKDLVNPVNEIRFSDGKCLFEVNWGHQIAGYRDMKDDFGIIPAPKYDEKQEKYYSNMANGEVMTLPRSYDKSRIENVGILLEAMSFYTYHEVLPVYKTELLQTKVARDDDSSRMLDLVFNGATYDFGINVWQDNIGNKIVKDIFIAQSDAVVSTLTALTNSVDNEVKKLRESIETMP